MSYSSNNDGSNVNLQQLDPPVPKPTTPTPPTRLVEFAPEEPAQVSRKWLKQDRLRRHQMPMPALVGFKIFVSIRLFRSSSTKKHTSAALLVDRTSQSTSTKTTTAESGFPATTQPAVTKAVRLW